MYIIPNVFNNHFGIFLNLQCIFLNFNGCKKIFLTNKNKPPNSTIVTINKFTSNLITFTYKPNNPRRKALVKMERKVQATSLFPNIALSGTKL